MIMGTKVARVESSLKKRIQLLSGSPQQEGSTYLIRFYAGCPSWLGTRTRTSYRPSESGLLEHNKSNNAKERMLFILEIRVMWQK